MRTRRGTEVSVASKDDISKDPQHVESNNEIDVNEHHDDPFTGRFRAESLGLSDNDRELLLQTLGNAHPTGGMHSTQAKAIPVPIGKHFNDNNSNDNQQHNNIPASLASSQGSTGSAFMSSVLNPTAGNASTPLSHTPPAASSYEAAHFGKRARSGSVSGRLRSASIYLEEKGLIDRHTRGILKDLIIIGDEEIQQALDRYEAGDPSVLEEMINSGALEKRLPKDLDILGDLDMDFLTMNDDHHDMIGDDNIDDLPHNDVDEYVVPVHASSSSRHIPMKGMERDGGYDGIGELDFAGDFVASQTEYSMPMQGTNFNHPGSKDASAASSPQDRSMLDYEKRMRSNSLFSALLNDPSDSQQPHEIPTRAQRNTETTSYFANPEDNAKYDSMLKRVASHPASEPSSNHLHNTRRGPGRPIKSALSEAFDVTDRKKSGRPKKKDPQTSIIRPDDEREEHVPGSGRPRSLSDPNLSSTVGNDGLIHVERPDGWVGAYSPDSRQARIERFMEKRKHRSWTKAVKYDVRKNFADSRLRVKGRFVKKDDELLMRELMSLT